MAKKCTKPGRTVYLVRKKGKVIGEYTNQGTAEAKAALAGGSVLPATKTVNWNCGRPSGS